MNPEDLRHIAVLQSIESDALARLADALEEKQFADGQLIFAEGDPADAMYFIREGSVRIERRVQAAGAPQKTLAVLEAGDYFGEMALFEEKPRSASTVANGAVTVLRLSKATFDGLHKNTRSA
jgi:CRP-like cAMP-binding protein